MRRGLLAMTMLLAGACHRPSAPAPASAPAPRSSQSADPAPSPGPAPPRTDRSAPPTDPSPTEAPDLRGVTGPWAGTYFYADPARPPVYFFADLALEGDTVLGTIVEPNTFGDTATDELHAAVRGTVADDGAIAFTKTYDGTAGVTHSVHYEGRLDAERTRIDGRWRVRSVSEGTFVMTRQSRRPGLARAPSLAGPLGPR